MRRDLYFDNFCFLWLCCSPVRGFRAPVSARAGALPAKSRASGAAERIRGQFHSVGGMKAIFDLSLLLFLTSHRDEQRGLREDPRLVLYILMSSERNVLS